MLVTRGCEYVQSHNRSEYKVGKILNVLSWEAVTQDSQTKPSRLGHDETPNHMICPCAMPNLIFVVVTLS